MEPKNSGPQDISSLIDQANSAIGKQASRQAQRKPPCRPLPIGAIFAGVLAIGALFSVYSIWKNTGTPGDAQIARDLDIALEKAHAAVEDVKSKTGALPETLPNAALASVVDYDPQQGSYQLTANMLGVRVTLQRDGKKTTEKGAR